MKVDLDDLSNRRGWGGLDSCSGKHGGKHGKGYRTFRRGGMGGSAGRFARFSPQFATNIRWPFRDFLNRRHRVSTGGTDISLPILQREHAVRAYSAQEHARLPHRGIIGEPPVLHVGN